MIVNIEYEALKTIEARAENAEKKVLNLQRDIAELTERDSTKVVVLENRFLFGRRVSYVKGFDSVKNEIEEYYKAGYLNEELEKVKKSYLELEGKRIKAMEQTIAEKCKEVESLKNELAELKGRGFLRRLFNL